ncbi:MAG: hypothetical protein AAGD38_03970 [Acidobacteriota bacterium]
MNDSRVIHSDLQSSTPDDEGFQGIDFLVGGVWVARFYANDRLAAVLTESFERRLNGHYLVSNQVQSSMTQPVAVATIGHIGVDPLTNKLSMNNFTSAGGYSTATQTGGTPNESWEFTGESVSSEGTVKWVNTITKLSQDSLRIESVCRGATTRYQLQRETS